MEQVTSNQVKEMIDQLAAMTAAASITPEIVASIFEKMRNLNDQEREKVIKVATEYIEEIRETGVDADKCRTKNGSNVQAELDTYNLEFNALNPLKDLVTDGIANLFDRKNAQVLQQHLYLNASNEFTDHENGKYFYYVPIAKNIEKGSIFNYKIFTTEKNAEELGLSKLTLICTNEIKVGGVAIRSQNAVNPIRGYFTADSSIYNNIYLLAQFPTKSNDSGNSGPSDTIVGNYNIFDKSKSSILPIHLYRNGSDTFIAHANGKCFYYIPIATNIEKGAIYSYKLFTPEQTLAALGVNSINLLCADDIVEGGVCKTSSNSNASNPIRGYLPSANTIYNNLYLEVRFSTTDFDEASANVIVQKVFDNLSVIKTSETGVYPETIDIQPSEQPKEEEGLDEAEVNAVIQNIINKLVIVKSPKIGEYPESLYSDRHVEVGENNLSKTVLQKLENAGGSVKDIKARKSSGQVTLNLVDGNGTNVGLGATFSVDGGGTAGEMQADQLNVIMNMTYKLKPSPINNANAILKTGWSGNLTDGFTHASGNTEPLEINVSSYFSNGAKLLITFNSDGITGENSDVLVSSGDGVGIKSYNGNKSFEAGVIYDGGNIKFTPMSAFAGAITNLKIREISADGTESYTRKVDNVYCQPNNLVFGYWNVVIGGKNGTFQKVQDGTRNISIGMNSMSEMQVGNRNVGVGTFSMPMMVEGENNIAIGSDTIYPIKKAVDCVAIGKAVLSGNNATQCIAIGSGAMGQWNSTFTRSKCTVVGCNAGVATLENCSFYGYRSGANVNGINNTAIGYNSMCVGTRGTVDVTGSELTCVGYKSEIANTTAAKEATNSTAIGANTTITKSNQVVIGNSAVEEVVIGGKKIKFNADGSVTWSNN